MARKKGRKIYTYRARNKRVFSKNHPMRSALGIVLTVLIAAVLGVVGYSIAGPVVARLTAEAEHPTQTDDPYEFSEADSSGPDSAAVTETASETASTAATTAATTVPAETTSETETTTTTETAAEVKPRFEGVTLGCVISPQTAADPKLLETAVQRCAEQGYTAIVLPAKLSGGALTYASENAEAKKCGAAAESPALSDLIGTVSAQGLSVIADMNLLEDNLFPSAYSDGSYQIKDNHGRWLDRAESDGGKPWLSPYTDHAKRYLSALAHARSDAGGSGILGCGMTFPRSRSSGGALLGRQVNCCERRTDALISVLDAMKEQSVIAYSVSLADAVNGKAEALDPDRLSGSAVCMTIDFGDFAESFKVGEKRYSISGKTPADQTDVLLQAAKALCGDCELIPCFVRGALDEEALDAVLTAANEAGCRQILVTN